MSRPGIPGCRANARSGHASSDSPVKELVRCRHPLSRERVSQYFRGAFELRGHGFPRRRPCESRDTYAAADVVEGTGRSDVAHDDHRWLWVPAFAGTTLSVLRRQWVTRPHSRDIICPSFALRFALSSQRAQGKPGADRTHGPRAKGRKHGGRTTGVTGNNPAFPARWATAYFVLSPARLGFFVTVSATRTAQFERHLPLGRQDHTTSPSAPCAFVDCAIRVHRISTHVRDDREAPLVSGETSEIRHLSWAHCQVEFGISERYDRHGANSALTSPSSARPPSRPSSSEHFALLP